jgi:hypothetical protein
MIDVGAAGDDEGATGGAAMPIALDGAPAGIVEAASGGGTKPALADDALGSGAAAFAPVPLGDAEV